MEIKHFYITMGAILSVTLLFIIGYYNFSEYSYLKEESNYINYVKEIQIDLDSQFKETQKNKQEYLKTLNEEIYGADEDQDGVLLSEEIKQGTSDYISDSDLDGVSDLNDPNPAGGGETHTETIEWRHGASTITTQLGIPNDLYLWYKNQDRMPAIDSGYVTYEDPTIKTLAEDLSDVAKILNEKDQYKVIVNFVQSMLYQYDIDYIGLDEYPKFPIQTIVEQKGDCEDTSYLLAALYKALGVDAVLVLLPGHMATAVVCDDCSGVYYERDGKKYYYLETTGEGWRIGSIPNQYKNAQAKLVPI